MASSHVKPNTWLFLRLPSETLKCLEIKPNTIIELGRLGSFAANSLLGRPYYYTYELLEKKDGEAQSRLRIVKPSELNAEITGEVEEGTSGNGSPAPEEALDKNNRLTVDSPSRQTLTQVDIEELKKTAAGQEIIDRILANHAGLDEKTVFSKAKYMLRKRSKYLKRFTVLPMEAGQLIEFLMDKEPGRILEMREETLGLIGVWSNVHVHGSEEVDRDANGKRVGGGRWLVVDETGGLVVASLADRMGILRDDEDEEEDDMQNGSTSINGHTNGDGDIDMNEGSATNGATKPASHRDFPPPASTNTLTVLHAAVQPNLSLLKYFGYDSSSPNSAHALHTHLKTLSWLQLLHPEEDPTYREPPVIAEEEMKTWKSGKRGTYWKKRRRWERCQSIVDETREGGFEGLVVASVMDPVTILQHAVALVRGGGTIVVYSATVEPLIRVMDLYSKERRTAYIQLIAKGEVPDTEDFPLDPRLLLAPTLQTSRIRDWQVLPGRTHPAMTSRGGSEGYVFTARRVMPLEGAVEARGNFGGRGKKRKGVVGEEAAEGNSAAGAAVPEG
ncbi:tRNA (adenine(58)-N(1))-methyltransferase non-catalytic subunit trm6 [Elasticomyces elasticus]